MHIQTYNVAIQHPTLPTAFAILVDVEHYNEDTDTFTCLTYATQTRKVWFNSTSAGTWTADAYEDAVKRWGTDNYFDIMSRG